MLWDMWVALHHFPNSFCWCARTAICMLTASGAAAPASLLRTGCCQSPVPKLVNPCSCRTIVYPLAISPQFSAVAHRDVLDFLALFQQSVFLSWPLFHSGNFTTRVFAWHWQNAILTLEQWGTTMIDIFLRGRKRHTRFQVCFEWLSHLRNWLEDSGPDLHEYF